MDKSNKRQSKSTNMAEAMLKAVKQCGKEGRSAGPIGSHIIKAAAKGVGTYGNGHQVYKIAA